MNIAPGVTFMTFFDRVLCFIHYRISRFLCISQDADYNWNSVEKGYILSAFSFGHCFTFLSGSVISKYGGANIFGAGIALTATLATLTPLFLNIHVFVFVLSRVLQGLFEVSLYIPLMRLSS